MPKLKETLTLHLNHQQLGLIHQALGELPFKQVHEIFSVMDGQMKRPENLIQDDPKIEDDRGAGSAMTGTDAS